jgi:hypothetical protein
MPKPRRGSVALCGAFIKWIVLISKAANDGVSPSTPGLCDDPSEGSVIGRLSVLHLQEEGRCGEQHQSLCLMQRPRQTLADATDLDQVMNDKVPDNVLLEIFDFYRADTMISIHDNLVFAWRWETLIQVCRR